jgi:hypothetical protein
MTRTKSHRRRRSDILGCSSLMVQHLLRNDGLRPIDDSENRYPGDIRVLKETTCQNVLSNFEGRVVHTSYVPIEGNIIGDTLRL